MIRLLLIVLAVSISGCSHFTKRVATKTFTFERSWARHTIDSNYLGYRVDHQMMPILFEDLVIQGNGIDGIRAYNKTSGHLKWERKIDGGVEVGATLVNGVLYFGASDGYFYALKAANGATVWSFPLRAEGLGRPLVQNGVVYFLAGNNSAYALKSDSGEQMWIYNRLDTSNLTVRGGAEPTVVDSRILFGFSDGYLVALDKTKGTLVWERQLGSGPRFKDVDSKPVLDGDRVYVSNYDGLLYCLSVADGKTIWSFEEGGYSPVTIEGPTLYYATSTSAVVALEKASGKLVWRKALKKGIATQPVYYKGLLIYGEWSGDLKAVDSRSGNDVAAYSTGRGVTSSPSINEAGDHLYVISSDANLFAFRLGFTAKSDLWPLEKVRKTY